MPLSNLSLFALRLFDRFCQKKHKTIVNFNPRNGRAYFIDPWDFKLLFFAHLRFLSMILSLIYNLWFHFRLVVDPNSIDKSLHHPTWLLMLKVAFGILWL